MSLLTSIVAAWHLDEASGNASDSVGSNTLVDNNSVSSGTGKLSGARSFSSASNQYLEVADNSDMSTGDIDFTFAIWINTTTASGDRGILSKTNGAGSIEEYRIDLNGGIFRFAIKDSAGNYQVVSSTFGTPSMSTWYLVIGWHDAVNNLVGISVNAGTADTVATAGLGPSDTTGNFRLGSVAPGTGTNWDGLLDEAVFWKRVLTSGERTQLYNSGAGLAYPFSASTGSPRLVNGGLVNFGLVNGGLVAA